MSKKITISQLKIAIARSPLKVKSEALIFLNRGLSEYKRIAVQSAPWRVGGSGGGVPRETGNLREKHYTRVNGFEGRFGVSPNAVRYAQFVHSGTKRMEARPWLEYARTRADGAVKRHYQTFMDNILKFIAT